MRILRFASMFFALIALLGLVAMSAFAADSRSSGADATRAQITAMLTRFLTPAVMDSAAGHDSFWADDLVYTSSAGKVMHKTDIMKSLADAPKPAAGKPASDKSREPEPVFTAEDILVRSYGDTAALTFRLVEHDPDGKASYFRNSGMFVKRAGKWQAVTWQATRVADGENERRRTPDGVCLTGSRHGPPTSSMGRDGHRATSQADECGEIHPFGRASAPCG